ncbi:hypothetical protein [Amycolatopsis sp. cmx-4-61]|uniref:hypothetical protein n=1 Tax=Amycolatopsis sp. cmx-4-61 TaxID=2790937 RepID=UPI0039791365
MPVINGKDEEYDFEDLVRDVLNDSKVQGCLRRNEINADLIRQIAADKHRESPHYRLWNVVSLVVKAARSGAVPQTVPARPQAESEFTPNVKTGVVGIDCQAMNWPPTILNMPSTFSARVDGGKFDAHPGRVGFIWELRFRVAAGVDEYEVGTMQTAHKVFRVCELRPPGENPPFGVLVTNMTGRAANDRHASATPPWYSANEWLGPQRLRGGAIGDYKVVIDDQPGYDFVIKEVARDLSIDDNLNLYAVSGNDVFTSWVILRKASTGAISYLYHCDWSIAYNIAGCSVTVSAQGLGQGDNTPVLDGARAVEECRIDTRTYVIDNYKDDGSSVGSGSDGD